MSKVNKRREIFFSISKKHMSFLSENLKLDVCMYVSSTKLDEMTS